MRVLVHLATAALVSFLAAGCDQGAVFTTEADSSVKDATPDLPQGTVPDGTITPDPSCGPVIPNQNTKGASVPWTGFNYEGETYTCNACPAGLKDQEGRWRHIDGKTGDPDIPLDDNYRERLELAGNTWNFKSDGIDSLTERSESQTVSGWYFCGDPSEIPSLRKVFVATSVSNSGAFGWQEGIVISADLMMDGPTGLLFNWRDGIGPGQGIQDIYCRIGSEVRVEGVAGAASTMKLCEDPFK